MKSLMLTLTLILINPIQAYASLAPVIDIYRTNQLSLTDVQKKCNNDFQKIATIMSTPGAMNISSNRLLLTKLIEKTQLAIHAMGNFSYVGLSPVMYPSHKYVYITIDVVDQADTVRLSHFLPLQSNILPDPDHLIDHWLAYQKKGFALLFKETKYPAFDACPAYHCLFGFDAPALATYKPLFTGLVQRNKLNLLAILRQDKDEEKRAAAAFLLAHMKDANELTNLLAPSIFDASSMVRNNVMRVLGLMLLKADVKHFPIADVILALDFPVVADRNKALFILWVLANRPNYAYYIKKHALQQLHILLKQSQPNIHDLADQILRKIKGSV